jgi:hypothetical protein
VLMMGVEHSVGSRSKVCATVTIHAPLLYATMSCSEASRKPQNRRVVEMTSWPTWLRATQKSESDPMGDQCRRYVMALDGTARTCAREVLTVDVGLVDTLPTQQKGKNRVLSCICTWLPTDTTGHAVPVCCESRGQRARLRDDGLNDGPDDGRGAVYSSAALLSAPPVLLLSAPFEADASPVQVCLSTMGVDLVCDVEGLCAPCRPAAGRAGGAKSFPPRRKGDG